jgi:hypothetical protein
VRAIVFSLGLLFFVTAHTGRHVVAYPSEAPAPSNPDWTIESAPQESDRDER